MEVMTTAHQSPFHNNPYTNKMSSKSPIMSRQRVGTLEAAALLESYVRENWSTKQGMKTAMVMLVGVIASAFGSFAVLVPLTHGIGGAMIHRTAGWKFHQPGKGGARFVALQTLAWTLYGVSLFASMCNHLVLDHDYMIGLLTFSGGLMSYLALVSSLLVFQNSQLQQVSAPPPLKLLSSFNEDLLQSQLMLNDEEPTDLWWLFVGLNTAICFVASSAGVLSDLHAHDPRIKLVAILGVMFAPIFTCTFTHAIGGEWKHWRTNFAPCMPFRGGLLFILLQFAGWVSLGTALLVALVAFTLQVQSILNWPKTQAQIMYIDAYVPSPMIFNYLTSVAALLGANAQVFVAWSLFFYSNPQSDSIEGVKEVPFHQRRVSLALRLLRKTDFLGLNWIFSGGVTYENSRWPRIRDPQAWLEGETKFQQVLTRAGGDKKTGDQYLIIGVGFVGKRLVKRLLARGETKIRLFDIMPHNPFPHNPNVEYVRGDVTKYEQVLAAMQGVHTVYSVFAIIRFMDRLEHQAALSYRINVGGTENVLKAALACDVQRMIVTSSSNATTDEFSEPRFNRDETSPYVTRATAFNHYGWTKGMADSICLKTNGELGASGKPMMVSIIRPCSGVFGGDDRHLMEKALDLGFFPGVGAKALVDLVYVENVVLGHLLLEAAMQCDGAILGHKIGGEAFNISNNEPITNQDFWFSVMKHIHTICDPVKVKSTLDFVFVPSSPLWVVAYISELNQKIFKGRVSLGNDLDMMSPGMLITANLAYTYNSDKATKCLGYEPGYTLDQAIQKSLYDFWEMKYGQQQQQHHDGNKKKD